VRDWKRVRAGEKPTDSYGYGMEAFSNALKDAGIGREMVDGLIVGPTTAYERMGELLGVNPRWGDQSDAVISVLQAVMAIEAGFADVVALVYGNDQRSAGTQYGGPAAMGGDAFLSYVYHAPWGLTSQGALYAMTLQAYKHAHGFTERDLGGWPSPSAAGRRSTPTPSCASASRSTTTWRRATSASRCTSSTTA
jgi:acetyl-CoA acetyltransferase